MKQSPPETDRSIRSFVIREGRMTEGQKNALEQCYPEYAIQMPSGGDARVDFVRAFGRKNPVTLEIGFGDGESLLEMARQDPDRDFLGIEVYRPGMGHLLLQLDALGLGNVRVMLGDAVTILRQSFGCGTFDRICLFFPDPWPKKKHHKRRILQADFIGLIADRLKTGGRIHFATDWHDYAEEALERFGECGDLVNLAGPGNFSDRPAERPLTKFESRGIRQGREVRDIIMKKCR